MQEIKFKTEKSGVRYKEREYILSNVTYRDYGYMPDWATNPYMSGGPVFYREAILSISHPDLGEFDISSIGKPFKIKGSPFSWKISRLEIGHLVLETDIICGLFVRKIYKFI